MQEKKTQTITARMTPADKKAICQLARAAGMTVTDCRTACALDKESVRVDGLDGLLSELKAQGRNCVPRSSVAQVQMTKNRLRKTDGRLLYHFVQPFSAVMVCRGRRRELCEILWKISTTAAPGRGSPGSWPRRRDSFSYRN